MTFLEISHDLGNIVGKSKYAVTRFSEAMRDLFSAIDEFLVVHDMEEQRLGLFSRKAELNLVGLLGLSLGQFTTIEALPKWISKQRLRPLQVLIGALSQIKTPLNDFVWGPLHEDVPHIENDAFDH
jgi:hypothetical protein